MTRAADLARERQRRRRARLRAGRIRVTIEADEAELIDLLTASGFLHPSDADDPAKIASALLKVAGCHA
jgi:hypothetical protein